MRTLVVIPTYNESSTIEEVIREAVAADSLLEVLVVDDGSPDGTADIADRVASELGRVSVMRRKQKSGLGDAYRAGFRWGIERGYEALVEMDADLSHDPREIPNLVDILSRADLVIGSRYIPGGSVPKWGLHRRLVSWGGNRYSAVMLGMAVRDLTSGFRAYRAETLKRIDLGGVRADGYGFQIEMAYLVEQLGGRIAEYPICFVDRQEGQSKMSAAIAAEAFGLVTKWGLARLIRRARRAILNTRRSRLRESRLGRSSDRAS